MARRSLPAIGLALLSAIALSCGSPKATPSPTNGPTATIVSPTPSLSPTPSATPSPTPSPTASPSATPLNTSGIPNFRHIYLIVMENKAYGSIVGSRYAPYEASLIARYGLATNFWAETHPSEPNYIAMTSGGLQGVGTDGYYNLKARSVFDQVETAGKTWHVYAQSYPGNCYTGSISAANADGPGYASQYVRKHNPAISYSAIVHDKARCANITRLSIFNPAAADFEMIVPNLCNDMHSCSVGIGDAFLKAFVPKILDSPEFTGSVLFITWDEGIGSTNRVATIAVSSGMTAPSRYAVRSDHYSLLRTIEDAWGMPALGLAAKATPLQFPY